MQKENMGNIITKLRKENNMTQKELADKLNVTDKAVSKWERGITYPDINTIPKVAEILGIGADELIGFSRRGDIGNGITEKKTIKDIVNLVLKAVGMAMGISSFVLLTLSKIQGAEVGTKSETIMTMLSIGLICIGVNSFNNENEK